MSTAESWHDRTISDILGRLRFLRNDTEVEVNKGKSRGADILVRVPKKKRRVNVEIQQFDSGKSWKEQTIPTWKARHKGYTLVVFSEPALERVMSKLDVIPEYSFFKQSGVHLFSDRQLSELVAFLGTLVLL
jgi:hypothetical protein